MSNIDLAQLVTAEAKTAQRAQEQMDAARQVCQARILSVFSYHAQLNLASAAAAGMLDGAELKTYKAALKWVANMRATFAEIAEDVALSPDEDATWPAPPERIGGLIDRY